MAEQVPSPTLFNNRRHVTTQLLKISDDLLDRTLLYRRQLSATTLSASGSKQYRQQISANLQFFGPASTRSSFDSTKKNFLVAVTSNRYLNLSGTSPSQSESTADQEMVAQLVVCRNCAAETITFRRRASGRNSKSTILNDLRSESR